MKQHQKLYENKIVIYREKINTTLIEVKDKYSRRQIKNIDKNHQRLQGKSYMQKEVLGLYRLLDNPYE